IIYNGVAFKSEFDHWYQLSHTSSNQSNQNYTFSMVGVLFSTKGQDIAIKALGILVKSFPNVRLVLVGKGQKQYQNYLQQLVDELNITNNVEFWGYRDDSYQAYLNCDAVLMCSENEAMGRVTVEAMSACRPVIGYDNQGTSELIEHDYTGLLYQNGHEELASCMQKFVENPNWAKQLGENAWHVAREKYCTEIYVQKVYQVLSSVRE
ncbi:MAG: glycosyltransferase, partial [Cyanobacteria bacterium P01_G01_bin.49]